MKLRILMLLLLLLLGSGQVSAETYEVTLEEALEIARENSIDVELAQYDLAEADLQYRQAEAAMIMDPSPTLIMQAQVGVDLANQNYLMAIDNLALSVQEAFYSVLKTQDLLEIAQEGLESARRHLDVAEKRYEAGTATRLDVIQATGNVLSSQAGVTQAKHGLELAVMSFRQTLGLSLDDPIMPEPVELDFQDVDIDLEDDLAFALTNREEIKQLEAGVQIAEKNVELADNDYTPKLELEQAKINLARSKAQLKQVRNLLELEITQSYLAIQDAIERIEVLEKGVEEATEMQRLSELMYESNMITGNELQDAQLGVLSARNDLVDAITDYNLAQARYYHTVARALRD